MRAQLGQHFLKNNTILKMIAETLNPQNNEKIIEIGPGHGELTAYFKNSSLCYIGIERDEKLYDELKNIFKNNTAFTFHLGDALSLLPHIIKKHSLKNYVVCGNIPYYITGHLFRVIGELPHKPSRSVFMIQREVAKRVCARPPFMNLLAASVQHWADTKILTLVSRNDFNPPPQVESAVVMLTTKSTTPNKKDVFYYDFIHSLFKQPRKTILNNLSEQFAGTKKELETLLTQHSINPHSRPQHLALSDIERLADIFPQH